MESREAYRVFLLEYVLKDAADDGPGVTMTLAQLIDRYLLYAIGYYPQGESSEYHNLRHILHPLQVDYGDLSARDFGPKTLKKYRESLIDKGLARSYINGVMSKIRRMYRWAVSEELLPVKYHQALSSIQGLRKGRTAAKETKDVKPVEWSSVSPVLAHLSPVVAAMVQTHWLTGCRSGSLVEATPGQFDRSKEIWVWRPRHKTEHLEFDLRLPIGPKCQKILQPFLDRPGEQPIFSPREGALRKHRRHHDRYTAKSYRRAVVRGIDRANAAISQANEKRKKPKPLIERWTPHQLRHSRGTIVREQFDLEAAQAILQLRINNPQQ